MAKGHPDGGYGANTRDGYPGELGNFSSWGQAWGQGRG